MKYLLTAFSLLALSQIAQAGNWNNSSSSSLNLNKSTISDTPHLDPLVVGTFWYRRAADFKAGANNLINNDIRINGEHYVGTSINHLIDKSLKFVIFDIEQWISFGDPFELQVAEYWDEYFLRLSA